MRVRWIADGLPRTYRGVDLRGADAQDRDGMIVQIVYENGRRGVVALVELDDGSVIDPQVCPSRLIPLVPEIETDTSKPERCRRGQAMKSYSFPNKTNTEYELSELGGRIRFREGGPVELMINERRFDRMCSDGMHVPTLYPKRLFISVVGGGLALVTPDPDCPVDLIAQAKP